MAFLKGNFKKLFKTEIAGKDENVEVKKEEIEEKEETWSNVIESGTSIVQTDKIREILAECQRLKEDSRIFIEISREKQEKLDEALKIIEHQKIWIELVTERYLRPRLLELEREPKNEKEKEFLRLLSEKQF